MPEKYKLKLCSKDCFYIQWDMSNENYKNGDCLVRALKENVDEYKYLKESLQPTYIDYTKPQTLKEIRRFIKKNPTFLGSQIQDCKGIVLEEENKILYFENPIRVRNHGE